MMTVMAIICLLYKQQKNLKSLAAKVLDKRITLGYLCTKQVGICVVTIISGRIQVRVTE